MAEAADVTVDFELSGSRPAASAYVVAAAHFHSVHCCEQP